MADVSRYNGTNLGLDAQPTMVCENIAGDCLSYYVQESASSLCLILILNFLTMDLLRLAVASRAHRLPVTMWAPPGATDTFKTESKSSRKVLCGQILSQLRLLRAWAKMTRIRVPLGCGCHSNAVESSYQGCSGWK